MLLILDDMNDDASDIKKSKSTRRCSGRKEKSASPNWLAAAQLIALAKEQGVSLLGPAGL